MGEYPERIIGVENLEKLVVPGFEFLNHPAYVGSTVGHDR